MSTMWTTGWPSTGRRRAPSTRRSSASTSRPPGWTASTRSSSRSARWCWKTGRSPIPSTPSPPRGASCPRRSSASPASPTRCWPERPLRRRRCGPFWPLPGTGPWPPTTPTSTWALSPPGARSMGFPLKIPPLTAWFWPKTFCPSWTGTSWTWWRSISTCPPSTTTGPATTRPRWPICCPTSSGGWRVWGWATCLKSTPIWPSWGGRGAERSSAGPSTWSYWQKTRPACATCTS